MVMTEALNDAITPRVIYISAPLAIGGLSDDGGKGQRNIARSGTFNRRLRDGLPKEKRIGYTRSVN